MNTTPNDKANRAGDKPPRRRGRPPKIDEKARQEIVAILSVGGSLRDAAEYVRVHRGSLNRARARDPEFARSLRQAVARGKVLHLKRIAAAPQWQAHAWMLERRWPREFGRRQHVDTTSTEKRTVTRVVGVDMAEAFPPMPRAE